jgi:hypothetical protein
LIKLEDVSTITVRRILFLLNLSVAINIIRVINVMWNARTTPFNLGKRKNMRNLPSFVASVKKN